VSAIEFEPVTSLPSSTADFTTKNPQTEGLGFSTTVITCSNNFSYPNIKNLDSIISISYEFSLDD